MAFLLVVWSIKNVVCGIVCLLALAWTAPKFGPEDSNALQEQLDQIHENLGRHDVSHSLESIQAWMAPSFEALPKYSASSGIGSSAKPRLQTLVAKHLLHSYFNLHHGLNIEGLQSYNSQREPNRQALADSALVKRSNKLRAALQESPQGYSLSELASIALLLQRLVMKEIRITFKVAWRLRNHSASAELTWEELHEVFCAALAVAHDWDQVIINLESLKRGAPAVFHERFRIGQEFATGHVKSWRNIRKFVTKLSRKSLRPAPFYSFKTALPTYLALYMGYGNYQNFDCRDMKTQLSRLDSTGSGRLPLKAYSKEHSWFREYPSLVGYLHKLETLASFYPKSPSVVVTNFVDGSHNCVSAHSQFAFCCISECTSILRTYEAEVQAPEASPEELLRITAMSMPFVNLTDALVVRLHNISSITGGKVHLHGRLFAEWLHVLVPYKCPWPSPRWREDDRAHLSNAPVDGREVPLESWYSESMRDLQRLLDDGIWTPDVHWSDDELLPLFEEPPELLKTKCEVSVIHLLVQIVVIAAGLNDLIWLCHWWHLPSQGSPGSFATDESAGQNHTEEMFAWLVNELMPADEKSKGLSRKCVVDVYCQPMHSRFEMNIAKDHEALQVYKKKLATEIFENYDADKDGYWNFQEAQTCNKETGETTFNEEEYMTMVEFMQPGNEDKSKGLSKETVVNSYLDPKHQQNALKDHKRVHWPK